LSRRRDALRHGIRSLIHDTSRELADLEGRAAAAPPPPEEPAPQAPPASAQGGEARETGPRPAVEWIVGPDSPAGNAPPAAPPAAQASRPPRARRAVRKTARRAARPRYRVAPPFAANGIDPQQAYSRKGVCSAYFVNHECWRVPDAYCNTALQVCALRNCPVYHLHKDTLERRFAGKFKHLW